jgi:mRNA interferase MazF
LETPTKGDIVLFPFPYTNLRSQKLRPCLVLSSLIQNDILLCQITSQEIEDDKYCVSVDLNDTYNGSLEISSNIRSNMLFTAEIFLIESFICCLDKKKYEEVLFSLIRFLRD